MTLLEPCLEGLAMRGMRSCFPSTEGETELGTQWRSGASVHVHRPQQRWLGAAQRLAGQCERPERTEHPHCGSAGPDGDPAQRAHKNTPPLQTADCSGKESSGGEKRELQVGGIQGVGSRELLPEKGH